MSLYNQINKTHKPKDWRYREHYLGLETKIVPEPYFDVVSIDPGTVNLAIRVERRFPNNVVQTIWFDLTKIDTKDTEMQHAYFNLLQYLQQPQLYQYLLHAHLFLIEWQMSINYRTVRVSQALVTFFQMILLQKPPIERSKCKLIEISPKIKSQVLKGPGGSLVKAWAKNIVFKLLQERGDLFSLQVLQKFKSKQDDLADTIVQIEAYCKDTGLPTAIDTKQCRQIAIDPNSIISDPNKVTRKELSQFLATAEKLGYVDKV